MPKKNSRAGDSLRRRGPSRQPLPRILVVCKGEVTEPRYTKHPRHSERIPVEVVIDSVPKTLVERAARLKREGDYDEVWCVFDIDEHPRIDEAKQQARDNKIDLVVISNPCFELWILLHYQEQSAHIHRHKLQSLCGKYIPGYQKDPPCADLLTRYDQAEKRAVALMKRHATQGTTGANPSTNAHELVRRIRSYRANTIKKGA